MKSIAKAILVTALIAGPLAVQAQKPALTQNIDEKGRTPYQQMTVIQQGGDGLFTPVPAGYRLVITNFSGKYQTFPLSAASGFHLVELFAATSIPARPGYIPQIEINPELYGTTNVSGFIQYFSFNVSVLLYIDAGVAPVMAVVSDAPVQAGGASISGYLIANP